MSGGCPEWRIADFRGASVRGGANFRHSRCSAIATGACTVFDVSPVHAEQAIDAPLTTPLPPPPRDELFFTGGLRRRTTAGREGWSARCSGSRCVSARGNKECRRTKY